MDLTKLDELAPKLETMKRSELALMLKSLQLLLSKAKDCIIAMDDKPDPPIPKSVDKNLFNLQSDPGLDSKLVAGISKHLKTLKYHPNPKNPDSPQICLYGSQQYCYNEQSASVTPLPILPGTIMDNLLTSVNTKLSTSFNSILINKYKDVNCFLGFHKDDEECLDSKSPISTLSLGKATRRMHISLNVSKHTPSEEVLLTPGSIFTMMPGFQDRYWHAIAAGRKSNDAERGMRYSLTFRKLLPGKENETQGPSPVSVSVPITGVEETGPISPVPASPPSTDNNNADTFVFGSSLVKGLKEQLLSKYSKNFKVFCYSGASVGDIRYCREGYYRREE